MKRLLIFACISFFAARAGAQAGFGPELGVGICNMHFAPATGFTSANTSAQVSGKIGGIVDFGLNRKGYIQTGIYLTRKGQSRSFSFYTSDTLNKAVDQTLTINYLEVPLNLLYKTGIQGKGRFSLGLGATASYIIGGRDKYRAYGYINGGPIEEDVNVKITERKPLAMFDLGVNLVGGYEFPTGLFVRAFFTTGVKDIGLGSEIDKNRVWGITAGYFFGKGRNINQDKDDLIDKGE
jgi:Outer membrane protein beta-barrel domain